MPRKPDARLESFIVDSALLLLDEEGMDAINMREVARRAGTTTPTLYERFRDREDLLWSVVSRVQQDVYNCVVGTSSIEEMAEIIVHYLGNAPGRLDLMNQYWPKIMSTGRSKPVFELAKQRLMEARNRSEECAEQIAYSLAALLFGTTSLMRTAGDDYLVSKMVKESSLNAVRVLCR